MVIKISIKAFVGTQWSDEDKGKIIDSYCSGSFDEKHNDVIRVTGGNNTGYAIVVLFHRNLDN